MNLKPTSLLSVLAELALNFVALHLVPAVAIEILLV